MKQLKLFFLLFCLSVFQLSAQTYKNYQDFDDAVQITADFDESRGELVFSADNRDFCDYYLYVDMSRFQGFLTSGTGRTTTIRPGNQQLFTLKVNPNAQYYSYSYQYTMYRGSIKAKPNTDFIYALPCVPGNEVLVKSDGSLSNNQLAFECSSDTLYASRGGIMCDDRLKDYTSKGYQNYNNSQGLSQITVYHEDGTFGEYVFPGKPLVSAGNALKIGTPIAIIDKNKDSIVRFSTYFLNKNSVDDKNTGNKHTYFRPFFQDANAGKVYLEYNKSYVCEITDEMLMQDMSKREKKKFLQNKEKK